MAQQDLTPQLRTRLNRVERAVGFFVTLATLLLLFGFGYYIYHLAKNKGWFLTKITYQTGVNNAAGLAVGNPVKLMGFNVGEITAIIPNDPDAGYGVTIRFRVQSPNFGYIWTDSKVRVAPADFLGNRYIEVLKGKESTAIATVLETNKTVIGVLDRKRLEKRFKEKVLAITDTLKKENPGFNEHALRAEATNQVQALFKAEASTRPYIYYVDPALATEPYWLDPLESPALTDRLESLVTTVEAGMPGIFAMTNKLNAILTNANSTLSEAKQLVTEIRPIATNLAEITENLRDPHGSLGEWILPKDLNHQLQSTLASAESALQAADTTLHVANTTLRSTDTNITSLVTNINQSLQNLADLTSNLNAQVQMNSNIVGEISQTIIHSDEFVQGLKRHWLLRSAFKTNNTLKAQSPYPTKRAGPVIPRLKH